MTFAEASEDVAQMGADKYVWNIEKFRIGFDDVRNTFSEDTENETIPLDELQKFTEKKRFAKKQFELAKHAVLVDEGVDDREFLLLQDLSRQLMNVELEDRDVTTEMTLSDICSGVNEVSQKRNLVDVAIRVVSVDGEFSDNEKTFVLKLCDLLGFKEKEKTNFVIYGEAMANAYSHWIEAISCCTPSN